MAGASGVPMTDRLRTSQLIVRISLLAVAAIAITGGAVQMAVGQPETTPRLDNVHRFMAGVYFSTGLIAAWAAWTIRRQDMLVLLIALGVLLAGVGRLVSIAQVGLPEPSALWLGYLVPELALPCVIAAAHLWGKSRRDQGNRDRGSEPGRIGAAEGQSGSAQPVRRSPPTSSSTAIG